MAIEINLTPEDIEKLVKDSIMRAGFGQAIEKALQSVLSGYNNPIEAKLREYVSSVCGELIEEHYRPAIREAVQKAIEARVTKEIIDKTVDAAVEKMAQAAEARRY